MADGDVDMIPPAPAPVPPVPALESAPGMPPEYNFEILMAHSWNIYRYLGDYLHLAGVIVLLLTILKNRGVAGISRSTQILYSAVFLTRYLDLLEQKQTEYLVFFKVFYILTSVLVVGLFWCLDSSYERQKDTCSLAIIVLPCITAATLTSNEATAIDICWVFSRFLEGFAMVPQYVFCYRDFEAKDLGVAFYVLSLGGYRVFYAANWIYKKFYMPNYFDLHSWIGGFIEICFFVDFLTFRSTGRSMLRSLVLRVDEKINEIKDKVELKVRGSNRATREAAKSSEGGGELRRRGGGSAAQKQETDEIELDADLDGV